MDTVDRRSAAGGVPAPAKDPLWAVRTAPSPSFGETRLDFTLPKAGPVTVEIFDLTGRLVRVLQARLPDGRATLHWDGTDRGVHPVEPGTYLARIRTPAGVRSIPIVRL